MLPKVILETVCDPGTVTKVLLLKIELFCNVIVPLLIVPVIPSTSKVESSAKKDQLAVFSEIYYPKGWNAYVDGQLTEHINADYVLRAMKVPAGNHKIEFK